MDLGTNRDCFPYSINGLIFKILSECVYCAVRNETNIIQYYLHVLYGPRNKIPLFSYSALTDSFLKPTRSMFTVRYELSVQYIIQRNLSF
jgi:hypothetical protein